MVRGNNANGTRTELTSAKVKLATKRDHRRVATGCRDKNRNSRAAIDRRVPSRHVVQPAANSRGEIVRVETCAKTNGASRWRG